ncbi:MAG: DapH/DapD/GlmU-related protein [Candidatus Lokiarchaeota archaeon]
MKDSYINALNGTQPIHPNTKFGDNVKLGYGVVIEEGCEIGDNTFIGHHTVLRPGTKIGKNCTIGHLTVFEGDSKIGDRVLIHAQCHITKFVEIEDDVFIAPFFCGANTKKIKHGRDFPLKRYGYKIRRAARIGIGVLIFPGIEIGENSQIGVGL